MKVLIKGGLSDEDIERMVSILTTFLIWQPMIHLPNLATDDPPSSFGN